MKRKQNLSALLVTVILALLIIAGCSPDNSTATPTQPDSTSGTQTELATTTNPQATEITVTDMAGRTVTVPAEIKSIATFGSIGVINAFVELMGCGDKIINQMSPGFTKSDQWKYQYVFAPQIANGPLFENASKEIQIEAVLEAIATNCGEMDEDIRTTFTFDEAKTLGAIEPLYRTDYTFRHFAS